MSIPLVQNNEKDSINTSIIAIKRQIERINMLLGLSNSEEIDTSVFATKTELEDAVTQVETELEDAITQVETDLAPVNEVTADNMQSVTSNAVANELNTNYSRVISVRASQNPDFITRYDISALLTGNCKLSIDIITVIDGYKESVAKVMITRFYDYKVYLHIVYNSNGAYPIKLENGILIVGNGKSYTYGGTASVTYL